MDALAFSIPVPVGRVKSTLPIFPAPQRSALVCVAPNRSRGPAKRHRSRPGGGGGQSDPPGPRRPRLDLGEAERLQKVMSRLGFASRRKSEVLIAEGKVRVNGRVVKDQGVLVNSRKDQITVEGKKLVPQDRAIWMAVHKPRGYLSLPKEGGTRSVLDLVPRNKRTGLIPVGGIDEDYSGIVILTNERAHVQEQSSPQNRHVKEWIVDCEGVVNIDALGPLERGVHLKGDSTKTLPAVRLHKLLMHTTGPTLFCQAQYDGCQLETHTHKKVVVF